MHCYICDKETNNLRRDPDGKLVSICFECRKAINECVEFYKDIDEDDIDLKISEMSDIELIKYIDGKNKDVNTL